MLPYHSCLTYDLYSLWHLYDASGAGFIPSFYQIISSNCKCLSESWSWLQMLTVSPTICQVTQRGGVGQSTFTVPAHNHTMTFYAICIAVAIASVFHSCFRCYVGCFLALSSFLRLCQYGLLLWPALHHTICCIF